MTLPKKGRPLSQRARLKKLQSIRRKGPQSIAELLREIRERRDGSRFETRAVLHAHDAIRYPLEAALYGLIRDPQVRFDISFHTGEILSDCLNYLVEIESILRGKRLPRRRLLGLAEDAVWHWPNYHQPELRKLLERLK